MKLCRSLFQLRNLILPVYLNDEYLKYFSDLKLYWANSKVSVGLIDIPLSLVQEDPSTTIGYHVFGKTTTHANTGFIGTGYMNAGLIGILIYAVVIGLCCRVIDFYAQFRGTKTFATLICLPGFVTAISSSDLPTTLFSGGWGLAILFVTVFEEIKPSGRFVFLENGKGNLLLHALRRLRHRRWAGWRSARNFTD